MGKLEGTGGLSDLEISFTDFIEELHKSTSKYLTVVRTTKDLQVEPYFEGRISEIIDENGSDVIVKIEEDAVERTFMKFFISNIFKIRNKYLVKFKMGYTLEFKISKDKPKNKQSIYSNKHNEVEVTTMNNTLPEVEELKGVLEKLGITEFLTFEEFSELAKGYKSEGFKDLISITPLGVKVDGIIDTVTTGENILIIDVYELGKGISTITFKKENIVLISKVYSSEGAYFTVYGKQLVAPVVFKKTN
ncbi:hypothetical protein COF68_05625 [Bacillus toyonensis]|uniref:hypothetical protein n=1 Tax=Bacillus toyonensis TaxID=155322 RepID=UPI000BFBEA7F|nr:hypothetical protein [Bacillus toyonensis]PHE64322.1 hypothetical protein COF68_05625 [Bacillus toyonensis]